MTTGKNKRLEFNADLKLGQSEIRFILSYLNYTFIPKNNNDPIFGNDAYFFGVNINLDNLFGFKESNLKKYFSLQAGSYNTGFGILTGLNIDYDIKSMPIYVSTYGKLYGLPNDMCILPDKNETY